MTIYDLEICLDEGYSELEEDIKRHADLKAAILNANAPAMVKPKHGKIHQSIDFWPPGLAKKERERMNKIAAETQTKRWLAAGDAMMAVVEPSKTKIVRVER